jgi:hypothetical protein
MHVMATFTRPRPGETTEHLRQDEVVFLVDVHGLECVDLEQDRGVADPPARSDLLCCEQIQVRVLFVDRWQILGAKQGAWVVVYRSTRCVVKAGLPARDREQRVVRVERRLHPIQGSVDRERPQQWVGAVGLQIPLGRNLAGVVLQDSRHRHVTAEKVRRTVDDANGGEHVLGLLLDGRAVSVDHDLGDTVDL